MLQVHSHDVSHFAAFFIVVGAKTSVAECVSHWDGVEGAAWRTTPLLATFTCSACGDDMDVKWMGRGVGVVWGVKRIYRHSTPRRAPEASSPIASPRSPPGERALTRGTTDGGRNGTRIKSDPSSLPSSDGV